MDSNKFGISKKMMLGILLQDILAVAALVITIIGIIRVHDVQRIMVLIGQAVICIMLISMGLIHFKERNRTYLKVILIAYAVLEAMRTALLNTTGINPVIASISRFILAIMACNCILIAEHMDRKTCLRNALAMVILEVGLYLVFLFGFPGMMYGHVNRYLPFVGILISGSITLFLTAKFEQLGEAEGDDDYPVLWQGLLAVGLGLAIIITAVIAVSINQG